MKTYTHIVLPMALLFTLISCASPGAQKVTSSSLKPVHGGELMKGEDIFVEVKGTENKIEIYPYQLNQQSGSLELIPADQVEVSATYSYLSREKNAGRNGRPTRKGEASIPLFIGENALVGRVQAAGTNGYALKMKIRFKDQREDFYNTVKL